MSERTGKRWYGWLDVVAAVGAAISTLGLVAWMVKAPPEWATVPRYLLILPASLVAYRFGRRTAWIAAAAGALLILVSLVGAFATGGLSSHVVEGLLASGLLFSATPLVARWGEQHKPIEALDVLQRIGQELNATLDLDHILRLVLNEAVQAAGATHGNVMLRDRSTGGMRLQVAVGYSDEESARIEELLTSPQGSIVSEVLEIGKPVLTANAGVEEHSVCVRTGTRSALTVPIFFEDRSNTLKQDKAHFLCLSSPAFYPA